MNGETLYGATDYFRPFPDAADVFSRAVDEHAEYLLPVASVSLSHLSPDWAGKVHFIIPVEPVGGYGVLGERSSAYHNFLCRSNWLGYALRGDRCELACDFRYFHKLYYTEHPPEGNYRDELNEMPDHYDRVRSRFAAAARHFKRYGWLYSDPDNWDPSAPEPEPGNIMRVSLFRNLGGASYDSNWSSAYSEGFPISRYPDKFEDRGQFYDSDRVVPQTDDGRDFVYVGEIEMWNYIGHTNGSLLLFYDPVQQIALTTFDWS